MLGYFLSHRYPYNNGTVHVDSFVIFEIPVDDPIRLLGAFVDGMELSNFNQTYRKIKKKKNYVPPRQLFKIMVNASIFYWTGSRGE